jgi:4-diphosphocytidyl-2-C-methyl-D-erythritol kinase
MKLRAFAKLNLSLTIVGRRADGYHELLSVAQTIDLADEIDVRCRTRGVLLESDLGLPVDEDLAGRAATLLLSTKGRGGGAEIRIRKRIPVGAGLGGGSSDAAAVLWSLDRLIPPRLPKEDLLSLAARLGSDVPLFLTGGRTRIAGRGERVTPLRSGKEERFVLLVPPIACATAEVYARFDQLPLASRPAQPPLGWNDLEGAALGLYPELARYREAVASLGAIYHGMSGAGSAFFAVFDRDDTGEAAVAALESGCPGASVFLCRAAAHGQEEGNGADRD